MREYKILLGNSKDKLKEYPADAEARVNTMALNGLYEKNTKAVYYIRNIGEIWQNDLLGIVYLEVR